MAHAIVVKHSTHTSCFHMRFNINKEMANRNECPVLLMSIRLKNLVREWSWLGEINPLQYVATLSGKRSLNSGRRTNYSKGLRANPWAFFENRRDPPHLPCSKSPSQVSGGLKGNHEEKKCSDFDKTPRKKKSKKCKRNDTRLDVKKTSPSGSPWWCSSMASAAPRRRPPTAARRCSGRARGSSPGPTKGGDRPTDRFS